MTTEFFRGFTTELWVSVAYRRREVGAYARKRVAAALISVSLPFGAYGNQHIYRGLLYFMGCRSSSPSWDVTTVHLHQVPILLLGVQRLSM